MAEQVILDISIPKDDIESAEQAIGRMRGRVEELRQANKNLDKSSAAYTKNALEIKKLSDEIRTNERVLVANTKAQEANEGSVQQLREQLKVVSVEWAKVTKAEGENTERSKQLSQQKLELTEQLKAVEKSTGDTRRNVGNYSEGMREALESSELFTTGQQALAGAQKVVAVATGGATGAMRIFKIALASTGIGAIVIALGSLVTYLTQTQKGMDLVNQVMEGAKAIFQVLIDRLLAFGSGLYDIFVEGEYRRGIDKLKESVSGLGAEIVKEAQAAATLEKRLQDVIKAEDRLNVERAKSRAEIEKLKFAAEDQSRSIAERSKAAEQALTMEQDLLNKTIDLQKERVEILKAQNELGTSTEEDLNRVREAEIQLANLQQESVTIQIELNNKLNSLRKEGAANAEAIRKEQLAKQEADRQKELEQAQETLRLQTEAIKTTAQEQTNELKRQLLAREIDREEYEQQLNEVQLAALISRKETLQAAGEDIKKIEREILDFKIQLMDEEQAKRNETAKNSGEAAKMAAQISAQTEQSKLDAISQTASKASSIFTENTAAYKILASTQAAIDTYRSATTALASAPPPFGQILAAANIAFGLAQVAKINATSVPQFAEGVIGLQGPGTSTSDSITAKLSKGESVMTAKATSAYAPQLAAMEESVGNRPNYQLGSRKFARGIIAAGNNPALTGTRSALNQQRQLVNDLSQTRIFLSLTELQERQREFNAAQRQAEISEVS